MKNIWHYRGENDWTKQTIDLNPEVDYDEILKSLDILEEPCFVLGNSENYLAVFKNQEDTYLANVNFQEIEAMIVIYGFPNLLKFINLITTTFLSIGEMLREFGGDD